MTEILGSTAAVTQLTAQLLKVKKLYADFTDTSSDISSLIEEVNALAEALAEIQKLEDERCQLAPDDERWKKTHQLFKSSVSAMQQLTGELDTLLNTHKRTGSVRAFLKRDQLNKCRDRLERVKTTMSLAQQTYMITFMTQQGLLMLDSIRTLSVAQPTTAQQVSMTTTASISPASGLFTSARAVLSDQGNWTAITQTSPIVTCCEKVRPILYPGRRRRTTTYNLNWPAVLSRKGIQLSLEQSKTSLSMTFRCYSRTPPDSRLSTLVSDRQWDDVQLMIHCGRATPFDLNHLGQSLLHKAVWQKNYEMCKLLVEYGLSPTMTDDQKFTPFHHLIWHLNVSYMLFEGQKQQTQSFDILMLLLSTYTDCLVEEDIQELAPFIGVFPLQAVNYIISMTYPSYETLDARFRAILAMSCGHTSPVTIRRLLGTDQTFGQALDLLKDEPLHYQTLMKRAARHLGTWYDVPNCNCEDIQIWMEIVTDVVAFEKRHPPKVHHYSYIQEFLYGREDSKEFVNRDLKLDWLSYEIELRAWLTMLKAAGADLVQYGSIETAYHVDHKSDFFVSLLPEEEEEWRIGWFDYGKDIADWRPYLVPKGALIEVSEEWLSQENLRITSCSVDDDEVD